MDIIKNEAIVIVKNFEGTRFVGAVNDHYVDRHANLSYEVRMDIGFTEWFEAKDVTEVAEPDM